MSTGSLPPSGPLYLPLSVYPQTSAGLNYITYPAGPTAVGTTITASASTNTKGSYTQMVASTTFVCNYMYVEVITAATSGAKYLLDVATGAAASEVVIVPNLLIDRTTATTSHNGNGCIGFPILIPAGSRIALRVQSSTGSSSLEVAITLVGAGNFTGPTSYTNYGSDTSTSSSSVSIDPGAVADTKSAYVQLTASTSSVAQIAVFMFSTNGLTTTAGRRWAIDIATGGAGSEVISIPDLRVGSGNGVAAYPRSYSFLMYIPASTRIAVRASCSTNGASDRVIYVAALTAVAPS